jgi:hypothetical protein
LNTEFSQQSLEIDAIPWILALAFADDAFEDHKTPQQLFAQAIPKKMETYTFRWKKTKEDLHVFRPLYNSTTALTKNAFHKLFLVWMQQVGYTQPVKIQKIQYEMTDIGLTADTMEAAREHSAVNAMKHAQSRIRSLSNVEIQALLLTEEQGTSHRRASPSLTSDVVPGYPMKLPDAERDRIFRGDALYQSLSAKMAQLRADRADTKEVKTQLDSRRSKIKVQGLKEYRQKWLETQSSESTSNGDKQLGKPDFACSRFAQELRCHSTHLTVVATMRGALEYSHSVRPQLVEMLAQMAQENEFTAYRPQETPNNGYCPVADCATRLPKYAHSPSPPFGRL